MKNRIIISFILAVALSPSLAAYQQAEEQKLEKEASAYEKANAEFVMIEAEKFFLLEDYERALAFLDQSLSTDPKNHAAYFKKAEVLGIQEKYEEGLEAITKAIEIQPDNKFYYILGAQLAKQNESLEDAKRFYDMLQTNASGYEAYYAEIIDTYQQTGNNSDAITLADKAIAAYPNAPEFYLKKAEIELISGQTESATQTLSQGLNKFPQDDIVLQQYVELMSFQGKLPEATSQLEQIQANNTKATLLLIDLYTQQGKTDKVKSSINMVFEDDEFGADAKALAIGYLIFNDAETGNENFIDSLQQVLQTTYPASAMVFENGGLIYSRLAFNPDPTVRKAYQEKAIANYKKLTQLNPGDFAGWNKVLSYEYNQKLWEDLTNDADEALSLFPNQAIFYYFLSAGQLGSGEIDDAEDNATQALRMSGSNQQLQSLLNAQLGLIQLARNNATQAETYFEKSVGFNTVHEEAILSYANYLSESEPQKALELLNGFAEGINQKLRAVSIQAKALLNQNNTAQSKSTMETALAQFPNEVDGASLEIYGDILFKAGQTNEALVQWQKALTLGGTSDKLEEKIANKAYN
ncbi:tetratricopeptide repeat protein [Roseivirga pacifica]|uniref:Tetratricopeptide repeat-containing protein n=1 Tax=Roseivirga pacifica TaxID=1267423 RepID=A0A1I0RK55_9BACT|nr:tetratricopeptide repeat protein [Roseivirga pacifica]RKQ49809.1 tetratricopeptide repeat protein [Roseivirga pacifica]SEW41453.1 Tetratricopeptide repeat-containing protein [Roseivirga pacifica]